MTQALGAAAHAQTRASAVLVIGPDINLYLRTATGELEIRPDWTQAARQNVRSAIAERLNAAGAAHQFAARQTLLEGRIGQVVRLHALVAETAFNQEIRRRYGRANARQWSLGPGVQEIGRAYGAERALFIEGAGARASAGRNIVTVASNANAILWAVSGDVFAAATLGLRATRRNRGPRLRASLVDLMSGDIVWLRELDARGDPRKVEDAQGLVAKLLEHAPL